MITIEEAETKACAAKDGSYKRLIRGAELEVICYAARGPTQEGFQYIWNGVVVSRYVAKHVLDSDVV